MILKRDFIIKTEIMSYLEKYFRRETKCVQNVQYRVCNKIFRLDPLLMLLLYLNILRGSVYIKRIQKVSYCFFSYKKYP